MLVLLNLCGEAFTLMHQNAPGLQFLKPDSHTWLDAPVKKEEFVVNLGWKWREMTGKSWKDHIPIILDLALSAQDCWRYIGALHQWSIFLWIFCSCFLALSYSYFVSGFGGLQWSPLEVLRATPHRVLQTSWERLSIIRFNVSWHLILASKL